MCCWIVSLQQWYHIIPKSLRKEIVQKLPEYHSDLARTLERAKKSLAKYYSR